MASKFGGWNEWEKINLDDRESSSDDSEKAIIVNVKNLDAKFERNESKINDFKPQESNHSTEEKNKNQPNDQSEKMIVTVSPKIYKLSISEFDPDEILFTKWCKNYYERTNELNFSDEERVAKFIDLMPDNLKLIIESFPKNSSWKSYRESIRELFICQEDFLLNKRGYKTYSKFLQFYADKLKNFNDDTNDTHKKDKIYALLPQEFKEEFEENDLDYESMKLYEFAVACCKIEKSLEWCCEKCKATTHLSDCCPRAGLDCKEKNGILNNFRDTINRDQLLLYLFICLFSLVFLNYILFSWALERREPKICSCPEMPSCNLDMTNLKNYVNQIDLKSLYSTTKSSFQSFFDAAASYKDELFSK